VLCGIVLEPIEFHLNLGCVSHAQDEVPRLCLGHKLLDDFKPLKIDIYQCDKISILFLLLTMPDEAPVATSVFAKEAIFSLVDQRIPFVGVNNLD
jgi:hypothetical protein